MQREDMTGQHKADEDDDMRLRRITLADGRYMIFYTFDEAEPQATAPATATKEEQRDV